jgi:DNA-binding transcriptional LysR family regulator
MNLRQVRYFLAVCEERHFTRAAHKCKVQQPSLTAAIKRLEREIGAPLFLRTSPVQLSELALKLQPLWLAFGLLLLAVLYPHVLQLHPAW